MFAKTPNASKAAFLTLAAYLFEEKGAAFIDCQGPTDHLRSLGGREMSRRDFLRLLRNTLSM
jgi:leucyl/phenylalanyl-tRNA--protein transferase